MNKKKRIATSAMALAVAAATVAWSMPAGVAFAEDATDVELFPGDASATKTTDPDTGIDTYSKTYDTGGNINASAHGETEDGTTAANTYLEIKAGIDGSAKADGTDTTTATVVIDGDVGGDISASNNGIVYVTGSVSGSVYSQKNSQVEIGGDTTYLVDAYSNGNIKIVGNAKDGVVAEDNSTVTVVGDVEAIHTHTSYNGNAIMTGRNSTVNVGTEDKHSTVTGDVVLMNSSGPGNAYILGKVDGDVILYGENGDVVVTDGITGALKEYAEGYSGSANVITYSISDIENSDADMLAAVNYIIIYSDDATVSGTTTTSAGGVDYTTATAGTELTITVPAGYTVSVEGYTLTDGTDANTYILTVLDGGGVTIVATKGDSGDDSGDDKGDDSGDDSGDDQGDDQGDDSGDDSSDDQGDDSGDDSGDDQGDDSDDDDDDYQPDFRPIHIVIVPATTAQAASTDETIDNTPSKPSLELNRVAMAMKAAALTGETANITLDTDAGIPASFLTTLQANPNITLTVNCQFKDGAKTIVLNADTLAGKEITGTWYSIAELAAL